VRDPRAIDDFRRAGLDNTVEVSTPEQVRFRFAVAGPTRRGLAYLVDAAIRAAILLLLFGVVALMGIDKPGKSTGVVFLALFAVEWGYYVLFEALWGGLSPGKRALGLRVIKEGGYPITPVDSVLRNLLRAADFLPLGYALGLGTMVIDGRFRRLGDLVAGTVVVIEERARVADPLRLSFSVEELDALPPRPNVSSDELEAIELFLRRKLSLSEAREAELAQMVAPLLAARLSVSLDGDASRWLALLYSRARRTGRKPLARERDQP
jgi:uncharacterized RDD family membrane protein YckC